MTTPATIVGTLLVAMGAAGVVPASLGVAAYTTGLTPHQQAQPTSYTYYCVQSFFTGLAASAIFTGIVFLVLQAVLRTAK